MNYLLDPHIFLWMLRETTKKRRSKKVVATKGTPPEQYPDSEE